MSAKKHTCALCPAQVKKATGEHALPEQLLKLLGDANDLVLGEAYDMYAATYQGRRENEARKLNNSLSAIRVPCCVSCNQWLNEAFEKPAAEHLPKLLQGRMIFTSSRNDIASLSRWLIKTVLMCHHPRVHYTGLTWKAKDGFPSSGAIPGLLADLRQSGEVPQHLSLWAALATSDEPVLLRPDSDATIEIGMNITRPDGILRLTVTDSKGMSVVHLDGTRPEVLRLWPLCAGCASCP
ncbi:hypothetical protein ACIQIG_15385 [Streptomyces bacillaris]|uniref:hypothetical protein n=1 Tax=Streptomyces TaxID=1883 RepID=UPI00114E9C60|nr:hypothetical protein [Streptomyces cavourensis]TQO30816.1 hypothetical protein FHX79_112655 [Streptomyces cavourensis]GGU77368.1 hypothetical protein GCM10010498_39160 [Streptomyces cavourensis]